MAAGQFDGSNHGNGTHRRLSVYLHPGNLHASSEATEITTILGSCVAVCLWDAVIRVGGEAHYLLPGDDGIPGPTLRYGTSALPALMEHMLALGSRPANIEAKIFGGSCLFHAFRNQERHLGVRNVDTAHHFLASMRIRVTHQEVGGEHGRRVVFYTDDGNFTVTRV